VYFNLEVTFYHPEIWNFKTWYYRVGSHILILGKHFIFLKIVDFKFTISTGLVAML
jgi:hypothetical protein